MAVGQFVDYSAGPAPGSFAFSLQDGTQKIAYGPEAEQLAQMLERQKASQPQPVAQAGGARGFSEMAGMGGYGGAQVADVPPPNPAVQTAGPPPQALARPPEQGGAQAPQVAQQPVPIARSASGGIIVRDPTTGTFAEVRQGSPGVSRAQLAARAGQGVQTPVSASQVVQGGFDRNADYEEAMANAAIDQRMALDATSQALTGAADAERQFRAERAADAAKDLAFDQRKQAEVETLHKRDLATYERAQEEVRTSKIEPNRIFSGEGGTLRAIGAAVAAGLGAFGASLARTPNFALDIINRAIDRDISAQEVALAKGQKAEDNALRQWMNSGATLEQAKAGVRAQQLAYADQKAAEIAAANKSPQIQAAYQSQSAEIQAKLAQTLETYRVQSLGQRTAEVSSRYAYPQGGSRGGVVPIALGDAQTLAGIAKTEREGTGPRGEMGAKAAGQIAGLDAIGERLQGKDAKAEAFAPEGQNIVTRGLRGAVNTVAGERTWLPGSPEQRADAQEFDQIRNDLMSQTSLANGQGAMSDPEAKRALAALGEARTWGELQNAWQYLREKSAGAASGFGVKAPAPPRLDALGAQKRGAR